jgi:arsenite methyltransferase
LKISKASRDVPLYETDQLRAVMGSTIRPGGLSLTDRAIQFCGLPTGATMIDIGCGPCGTMEHLANKHGMRIIGIDPSRSFLSAAMEAAPGLPVTQGIAESLPFRQSAYDGIICECVLSLVKDPHQAVAEFARVLKPGGRLIISDMYVTLLGSVPYTAVQSCLAGPMLRHEMEALLETHGFSPLLFEDHTELLKELVVQLILSYGSLQAFGTTAHCGKTGEGPGLVPRIGYCLLIAKKHIS